MSSTIIEDLAAASRIRARESFHRRIFEVLLGAASIRQEIGLTDSTAQNVQGALARWIVEAPVGDERGSLRLIAARRPLRGLLRGCGQSPGGFLRCTLGIGDGDLSNIDALPAWKRTKLALLGDASLWTPETLDIMRASDPSLSQLAAIVSLDACPLDDELSHRTEALGKWLLEQPPINLPLFYLPMLQETAFFVSYLAVPARHAFKRAIARQAAHLLGKLPEGAAAGAQGRKRPRLTVVGELLFPAHAMFRCYAEALGELLPLFDVTLIADEVTRCPEHASISHRQLYFPPFERDVGRLVELVRGTKPDIVLYPSVGMSFWTFILTQLRLAPLQLMSVGHPAPACTDEIDGVLLYRELALTPLLEYGRLIPYDRQPLPLVPHVTQQRRPTAENRPPVIAVNAAGIKLNAEFLGALDDIIRRAPADTGLHFFPNAAGTELLALRHELGLRYPGACVHAPAAYADYMAALAHADIVLQSFPFGGTNTVMDALALGIPMVCLRGDDLASRVDPVLLGHSGLGELCADDVNSYVRLAVELLTNTELRARLSVLARSATETLARVHEQGGQTTLADAVLECWETRV